MTKINFPTPVCYDTNNRKCYHPILEAIDGFFYFGNKRAYVIPTDKLDNRQLVEIREMPARSMLSKVITTALKIALFITGIIPLLMFIGKLIFRAANNFQIKSPKTQIAT